jgi:coproporphyrinogen III oxidase-like Fe-S oxidoreductase
MIERIASRYVYRKCRKALDDVRRSASPPTPPPGENPLQVYLHVPFCEELCGFCAFNRQRFEKALAQRYFAALRKEIAMYRDKGCTFDRVYVGGGTPTVLPEELASTIALIRSQSLPFVISVETHPDHLNEHVCTLLEESRVNRLSIGVQSFQEGVLSTLARHKKRIDGDQTRERLTRSIARFKTVNVDMIFGVPGQTLAQVNEDIRAIKELLPHQVTFYPLMTPVFRPNVPSRELYARIVDGLSDVYRFSSGWSFSLNGTNPPEEYIAGCGDFVGLGAGSFGFVDGAFYANSFSVPEYVRLIEERKFPVLARKRFRPAERMRYHLLMGLYAGRIDLKDAIRKFGFFAFLQLWKELLVVAGAGGISLTGRSFAHTQRSRFLSARMMKAFMSAVSEFREICRALSIPVEGSYR